MLALLTGLAAADSAVATFRVDAEGATLVRVVPAPGVVLSKGAGDLRVLDGEGRLLASAALPDKARDATIIYPEGGGAHFELESAWVRVPVPWPDSARSLQFEATTIGLTAPAPSDPVVAVDVDGPSDRRLDLLYLGDGYTVDELDTYREDVARLSTDLITREPYASYSGLISVWRVDTASAESGASHYTSSTIERDTAFDCYYGCGVARGLCCDDELVGEVVDATLPAADAVVVLVNDSTYGGIGASSYCTSYTGTYSEEVHAHELGHHILGLWDEYSYGYAYGGAGGGPNCTSDSTGATWSHWLDVEGIGAYTPCSYTDFHSPTNGDCLMYTLYKDLCAVCLEHSVRVIYEHLDELIVDPLPEGDTELELGDTQAFSAEVLGPDDGSMEIVWSVDEVEVEEAVVTCAELGSHTITMSVADPTSAVLLDTDGELRDTHTWTLTCVEAEEPEESDPPESEAPDESVPLDSNTPVVEDSDPPVAATPPPFSPEPRCGCGAPIGGAWFLGLALFVLRRRR